MAVDVTEVSPDIAALWARNTLLSHLLETAEKIERANPDLAEQAYELANSVGEGDSLEAVIEVGWEMVKLANSVGLGG